MDSRLLRPRHPSWLIFHVCFPPWKHPLHSCPVPLSQKLVHKINLKTSLSPTRGEKTTLRANSRQQESLEYFSKYVFRIWEKNYIMKYVSDVSGPKFVGAQRSEKHESQNRCWVYFWGGIGCPINLQETVSTKGLKCKEWKWFFQPWGILESHPVTFGTGRSPRWNILRYPDPPKLSGQVGIMLPLTNRRSKITHPMHSKQRHPMFKKHSKIRMQTHNEAFNNVYNSLKLGTSISWVRK